MPQPVSLRPKQPAPGAKPAFSVPPPATMPPGITGGTPPLPAGKIVKLVDPSRLLPEERQALERVGWVEGQPIPETIATALQGELAAANDAVAAAKQSYAVDPSTPPLQFKPVSIESLPVADQRRYNQVIASALQGQAEEAALEAPPEQSILQKNLRDMSTGQPPPPLARPAPPFTPPGQPARPASNPKAKPPAPQPPQPQLGNLTAPPSPQEAAAANRTEEPLAPMTHCPHCRWDLSQPDQPEPEIEDRQTYLQSLLGEIQYVREVEILGGAIKLTLRTLTTREVDACFQQCFRERDSGKIVNEMDFFERLNRFRLYLQLQRVRSNQFDHDMPDGLDEVSAPNAQCHWDLDPNQPPLEQIEQFMLTTVLKTESVNRVIQQQANRFNRLVARLEVMVDNSDFWKATEAAS